MHQKILEKRLSGLPISAIRYYKTLGSTNDIAAEWADQGAPNCALVIADEQTAGRGRGQRRWFTPAGAALAFSLILRPEVEYIARVTGLGALGVCQALQKSYGLTAKIKWPNDVLVCGRKLTGVLTEASWIGDRLSALILGIGINVARSSVPPGDWPFHHQRHFPATSVEAEAGEPIPRLDLLHAVLDSILTWLPELETPGFLQAWENALAFRGEWVWILSMDETDRTKPLQGKLIGLREDGSLCLESQAGEDLFVRAGDVHLRPVDSFEK